MALFNIASKYDQKYLNSPYNKELIFTKDKHLITHGVDFLSDYESGIRGLVPNYNLKNADDSSYNYGVLGINGWTRITTDMLPIASNDSLNSVDKILNASQVQALINAGFAANDAMVFKGVLVSSQIPSGTLNTYNNVPASGYNAGWTYRAAEVGTYAGIQCQIGDLIIAVEDADSDQTNIRNSHWTVIQTNIVGTATFRINGTEYQVATNVNPGVSQTFVAPSKEGGSGQILSTDANKNLVWIDQTDINAGTLEGKDSSYFVSDVSISNGTLIVEKGNNTTSTAIVANKLANSLKLGEGLLFKDKTSLFDGSVEKELNLLPATKTTIGGVIIDNTTGSEGSDKSTVSIDTNGRLYLTQDNVINALGFRPTAPNDVMEYNIVNTSADGIVPKLITTNQKEISAGYFLLAFSGNDTEPSWYRLSASSLNNTWRPITVNGNGFLSDSTSTLNLVAGDNIELIPTSGSILIKAVDTTYEKVTSTTDGLMSKEDFIKLNGIEEGSQKNVPAFAKITTGSSSATATDVQDSVTFNGENIEVVATSKNVSFILGNFVPFWQHNTS